MVNHVRITHKLRHTVLPVQQAGAERASTFEQCNERIVPFAISNVAEAFSAELPNVARSVSTGWGTTSVRSCYSVTIS
jgi:hypothetical protein